MNESLRDIPGSGPARKQAVLAALKHLEALSQKSTNDLALTEDLAAAYEQSAEIMSSLFEDSREASSLAIPALIKAVRLRSRLAKVPKATSQDILRLAEAERQLGSSQLNASQPDAAIKSYGESIVTASTVAPGPESLRVIALARSNLCTANTILNRLETALPECREAARIFSELEATPKSDVARLRILTRLRYGNALSRADQVPMALREYKTAMSEVDPLDAASAPIVEEFLEVVQKYTPTGDSNRILALAFRKYGILQSRAGNRDQSLESFERSMRLDVPGDPPMKDVIAYAEACLLMAEARGLQQKAQVQKAIETSKKALNRIGESTSGSASLLRDEIEASLRSFESLPAQPPR